MLIHRRVMELMKGVRCEVFVKLLLGLIISATYIVQSVILGRIVGQIFAGSELAAVAVLAGWLLVTVCLRAVLIWLNSVSEARMLGVIRNTLRGRLYDKLCRLGPGYLSGERSGQVESTIVSGVDYLEGYLGAYLPQVLLCFLICGGILIYFASLNWLLALIGLVSLAGALLAPSLLGNPLKASTKAHWDSYGELNSELIDGVQGMRTLKAYNRSGSFGISMKHQMQILFERTMRSLRINLLDVGIVGLCSGIGRSLILGVGALLCLNGRVGKASLVVLLFMTGEFFRPIADLGRHFHEGFMGMTSSSAIFEILDAEPLVADDGVAPAAKTGGTICFESVSFTYPNREESALTGVSFELNAGRKIAVVGESGSGKSTILQLLQRFYDPTEGCIYYAGRPLSDYALSEYRKTFSVVSQHTYLFTGTVRENLRLGNPGASDEDVANACRIAQIHDDIAALPQGYDSVVEERGLNFSGGQKQRIALARALLKNAPILLFDEPTSSIDLETEHLMKHELAAFLADKAVITAAHRLDTIRDADLILVLSGGRVVEKGTHDELLAAKGRYFELFDAQAQNKEAGHAAHR